MRTRVQVVTMARARNSFIMALIKGAIIAVQMSVSGE